VVKGNIDRLEDAGIWWQICYQPVTPDIDDAEFIGQAASLLPDGEFTENSWSEWTKAVSAETGVKGRGLFMPLRKALTGQSHGPDMGRLLPFIGRQTALVRLQGKAA
jgi:glutamyl-tRNA synthetase